MLVKYSEHDDGVLLDDEEDGVRENAGERAPNVGVDRGKLLWVVDDSHEQFVHLGFEPVAEAGALSLISERGLEEFDLSFTAKLEADHRRAA